MGSCATPVVCPTQRTRLQLVVKYWGTIVPVALQSRGHSIFQLRNTEALASFRFVAKKSPLKHHALFWTGGGNSRKCWGGGNVDDKTELPRAEISPHGGCPRPILYRPTEEVYENPCWENARNPCRVCSTQPCPTGPTPNGKVLDFSPLPPSPG